jgi:hypothetical protein
VFVWSWARAQAAARSRAKKLDRARDELERAQRGLGGVHYRTAAKVADRVQTIARARKLGGLLRAQVGPTPPPASPPFPGRSTRLPWPPSRPPTAGMGW